MGNTSSKKSGEGFQSYPSFSRSDTQGSAKSSKSIRSRLSISSEHSYKSAVEDPNNYGDDYSRGGSANGNGGFGGGYSGGGGSGGNNGNGEGSSSLAPPSMHNNHHRRTSSIPSPFNRFSGASEYPFTVPKSMQQLEPKEPILMNKTGQDDGNNTINNSNQAAGPKGSAGGSTAPPPTSGSTLGPEAGNIPGTDSLSPTSNERDPNKDSPMAGSSSSNNLKEAHAMAAVDERHSGGAVSAHVSPPPPTPLSGNSSGVPTPLASPSVSNINIPGMPISSGMMTPGGGAGRPSTPSGASFNVEETIQRLLDAGYSGKTTKSVCLKNQEIVRICQTAREIFLSQPMLLELSPPVKIVGDVHGQYGDLIRMFDMCGFPPAANYLFLGDYVDRGKQSLETILLLLCYKIKYPENFFLLRGNHECANVTRVYGFYDECKRRCNIKTWKMFIDTFNALPIAAVVAQKIFCVHGGLSPSLNNLNEIRSLDRPTDVPDYGLLNDLLWSDPADTPNEWEDNERGVSYCFNKVAINKFLARFSFDLVCRAHMVVEDGYEFFNERSLVTVFSAPNYCGEFDNWGAVMSVSEELLCSFELLKPLDSVALKQEMRKGKQERRRVDERRTYEGPQSY